MKNMTFVIMLLVGMLSVVNATELVNINTADADTIAREVTGIGKVKARAIVKHREANGPFDSVDGLLAVNGIGKKTVEMIRGSVVVSDKPRR